VIYIAALSGLNGTICLKPNHSREPGSFCYCKPPWTIRRDKTGQTFAESGLYHSQWSPFKWIFWGLYIHKTRFNRTN